MNRDGVLDHARVALVLWRARRQEAGEPVVLPFVDEQLSLLTRLRLWLSGRAHAQGRRGGGLEPNRARGVPALGEESGARLFPHASGPPPFLGEESP